MSGPTRPSKGHRSPGRARTLSTVMLATLLLLAGCAGSSGGSDNDDAVKPPSQLSSTPTPATFEVSGRLTIENNGISLETGDPCNANTNYLPDLAQGAPIIVRGSSGNELALDRLPMGEGRLSGRISSDEAVHDCLIDFAVSGVPAGEPVYQIVIGDRAPISFAESEANSISLTIDTGIETEWDLSDLD